MTHAKSPPNAPFDRSLLRQRRKRAATTLAQHDFLLRKAGGGLLERLVDLDVQFPVALNLGCHRGELTALLPQFSGHGIGRLLNCDLAPAMVASATGLRFVADEEALPVAARSLDLVLNILNLHAVNDLPGSLVQIRRTLRPGGLFLASMFGGETLHELRYCLMQAEMICDGGVSPRIAPFVDVRDAGALLQRAGFARPVADVETLTVSYADPLRLMHDLRGMGESNILYARRRRFMRRDTLSEAIRLYHEKFSAPDGKILATFQIVNLTGWAPADDFPPAPKVRPPLRLQ